MKIHCNRCRKPFKENDIVYLDEGNTVTHQKCYSLKTNLYIKYLGTFKEVTDNNPVLKSL